MTDTLPNTETESKNPLFEINEVATSCLFSFEERLQLYDRFSIKADDGVCISERVFFTRPDLSLVRLGSNVFINTDCYLDNSDIIEIGDEVCIGPHVKIYTSNHRPGTPERRAGGYFRKPVSIGAGTWVRANVVILPGVAIGDGCIIAAGSTIFKDVPPHHFYLNCGGKYKVEALPTPPQ